LESKPGRNRAGIGGSSAVKVRPKKLNIEGGSGGGGGRTFDILGPGRGAISPGDQSTRKSLSGLSVSGIQRGGVTYGETSLRGGNSQLEVGGNFCTIKGNPFGRWGGSRLDGDSLPHHLWGASKGMRNREDNYF